MRDPCLWLRAKVRRNKVPKSVYDSIKAICLNLYFFLFFMLEPYALKGARTVLRGKKVCENQFPQSG